MALGGPHSCLFSKEEATAWHSLDREEETSSLIARQLVSLQMAVDRWSPVCSSLGWWDGGLGHSQFLSQVIEASDVVHAALTHHTSKLRVHLQAQPKSVYYTAMATASTAAKMTE